MLQSDLERLPPPSPSGCCGADKSRTALARPAPLLRPLPPLLPPPPPQKVSGGKRRARGRGGAGPRAISTGLAPPGHAATLSASAGPLGAGVGRAGPWGTLDLKPPFRSAERKRERSPRRLSPISTPRRQEERCSPAPSSPAPLLWCVNRASAQRSRRGTGSPSPLPRCPLLPPSQPWGPQLVPGHVSPHEA